MLIRKSNSTKHFQTAAPVAASIAPVIENLEGRQLFSATASEATIPGSSAMALNVSGSAGSNAIYVGQTGSTLVLERSSNGTITGIWLHNPWGVDLSTGLASAGHNDGANDGYVLVTPATLFYAADNLAAAVV